MTDRVGRIGAGRPVTFVRVRWSRGPLGVHDQSRVYQRRSAGLRKARWLAAHGFNVAVDVANRDISWTRFEDDGRPW
jgi:hypothetical protein